MADTLPSFINDFQARLEKRGGAFVNGSLKEDAEAGLFSALNHENDFFSEEKSYPWLPEFSNVVEKIMAICSDPRTHLKTLKEVKQAEKAVKIDNTDIRMTLRVPRFWKQKNDKMLPEYIYSDIFETEYAIYENRFIVALIDKMLMFLSHVIADLYSQVRFLYQYVYDQDIDMPDIDQIQQDVSRKSKHTRDARGRYLKKKDQVEPIMLLTTADSPIVKTLMKLLKLRSDLSHAISTPFYKTVKKSKPLSESDVHITNLLAGDKKYAPCFRFYLRLLSLLAHQHEAEVLLNNGYINFCVSELLLAYRRLGFRTSTRKVRFNKRKNLEIKHLKFIRKNITADVTLRGSHITTLYRYTGIPKQAQFLNGKKKLRCRVSIDIVPSLTADYPTVEELNKYISTVIFQRLTPEQDYENAFVLTSVNGANDRGAILCSPFFGKLDANIENMLKASLTFIEADKWTYSKVCPVCGFYVDGEQEDGNCYCANCDSVYSIIDGSAKRGGKQTLWLKRLHNSERKGNPDESIRLEIIQTDEDLQNEQILVRLLEDSDLNEFYGLTKQAGILELQGQKHVKDKASAKKLLAEYRKKKGRAIVRKSDNKMVGLLILNKDVLQGYRRFEQMKVDFLLGRKYWGFGYATAALDLIVDYVFKRLRIDMLWAQCGDFNKPAARVLAHNDFLYVDSVPDEVNKDIVQAKNLDRYVLFNPYPVRHAGQSTPGSTPREINLAPLSAPVVIEPLTKDQIDAKNKAAKTPLVYKEVRPTEEEEAAKRRVDEEVSKHAPTNVPPAEPKEEEAPVEEDPFAGLNNVTFEEKLKRSSEDLKQNYEEIRDYILSYGTAHRISRKYDAYHKGMKRLIIINIRGTHLRVYGAIPSKALADSTMNVYDDSKTKIYQDTPSFIKVTGSLSYKWAFRFVDEVMKANGIEKPEPAAQEVVPEKEPEPVKAEETKPAEVKPEEVKPVEVKPEEPKPVEPAPAPVVEPEPVDPFANLKTVTFQEKLDRADKALLDQYTQLRDYILSKGANHRITKKYDSFWIGRNTLFLLVIRGTHIRVYGAAQAAEFKDDTMNVYDDSKTKAYEGTPTYVKVVGDMSFKWALRFIDQIVAKVTPAPVEQPAESIPAGNQPAAPAEAEAKAAAPEETKPAEAPKEEPAQASDEPSEEEQQQAASNEAADELITQNAADKAADELINAKMNSPKN